MTAERPRCSRSKWLALLVGVGLAAACGSPVAEPAAVPPALELSLRILREGAAALPKDESPIELQAMPPDDLAAFEASEVGEQEPTSLTRGARLGPAALRGFLESPFVESAVGWGCWATPHLFEDWLVALLAGQDDEDRAIALAVLVRVRAPRHVVRQWQVLQELDRRHGSEPAWAPLLAALHEPFAPENLEAVLRRELSADRLASHETHQWALRAVGVRSCRQLLTRVVVWSRSADPNVALAAERSLHDFSGPDADRALADCLLGFGPASGLAGDALSLRDPGLLIRSLLGAEVPADERWLVGQLLAEVEHPAAVPHLCASVGSRAIVDRAMFAAIERLATVDHWPLVEALPSTVRPEQKERATAVVTAVRTRLKL